MIPKLIKCIITTLLFVIAFNTMQAQDKLSDILRERGEIYCKIKINKLDQANFTKLVSIDNKDEKYIYFYASKKEYKALSQKIKNNIILLTPPGLSKTYSASKSISDILQWDVYPSYNDYIDLMYSFENQHPDLCQIIEIGKTTQGRSILFAKITDNANVRENEARFMYCSSIHGDETTGYVLMLRLINYLLENHNTSSEIQNLVNNTEIWICPLENPDGTYASGNNSVTGATRYNANHVDLNRNYPSILQGDHPDGNAWQPETQAMMNLFDSIQFAVSAEFHGGAEVLNYPWDSFLSSTQLHAEDEWFINTSQHYADTVFSIISSGYLQSISQNGITNGGDWYVAHGTRQDYFNYFHQCREITIEMSNTKMVAGENLPDYWNYNYQSMINHIKTAHEGIRGLVMDSITSDPLLAQVSINNAVQQENLCHSDSNGFYFYPKDNGSFNITAEADGYRSKTFELTKSYNEVIEQNFQLVSLDSLPPLAAFSANPEINNCNGLIELINISSASDNTQYIWHFGDGNISSDFSPTHVYQQEGNYNVFLEAGNQHGSDISDTVTIVIEYNEGPEPLNAFVCDTLETAYLSSDAQGETYWYDQYTDGNLIHIGDSMQTPPLDSTQVYFAQSVDYSETKYIGKQDNSGSGDFYSYSIPQYMVFDVFSPCILKFVTVYAETTENRTIYLKDSTNQTIDSVVVFVEAGMQRIPLYFNLLPGENYRLEASTVCNLYRNMDVNTNYGYPFTINNVLSITTNSSNDYGYYYYFYNWEISETVCYSKRTPVFAYLNKTPEADFNYSVNDRTVSFFAAGNFASGYTWNIDENITYTSNAFVHTFLDYGYHEIELIAFNPCSSDTITSSIFINNIKETKEEPFKLFPNPASNVIYLHFPDQTDRKIVVQNIYGETLKSLTTCKTDININIKNLSSGTYYITIQGINKIHQKTIVKYR
ncbi:MAG: hypothetical protein C0594_11545 [Marinilabiliales bacterium]|nr:MAG: hypothetical protein C0594_11545 [Marinilabiliales bacterium]